MKPRLLFVSLTDWHLLWEREQQIASRLSRDFDVYFVQGAFTPWWLLRRWDREVSRLSRDLRSNVDRDTGHGVTLVNPPPRPFPLDKLRVVNKSWLALVSAGALRVMQGHVDVLYCTRPIAHIVAPQVRPRVTVSDWGMTWLESKYLREHGWLRRLREMVEIWKSAEVDEALRSSDVIFTSAAKYQDYVGSLGLDCTLIPNGADVSHFSQALTESLAVPPDLEEIPEPRLGIVAANITPKVIDYPLIDKLANELPGFQIVFIGVVRDDVSGISRSNVHFLGKKPYAQLPAYLKGCRVCLVPYLHNVSTQSGIPTKVPEYLAAGRPVVSTYFPDIERFFPSETVLMSDDHDVFVSLVKKASRVPDCTSQVNNLTRVAADFSWDREVERMTHEIIRRMQGM